MILIHPPAAKPCEPPAGIARLLGALRERGIPCRGVDLNLEVMLGILGSSVLREDDSTWTARARRGIGRNTAFLGTPGGYADAARYRRAVEDLNRVLAAAAAERGARLSFSDYGEASRSPVRSGDLIDAFRKPEESPLHPWFAPVLERIVREERPSAAGISLSFLSQALPAFAAAGFLRRLRPDMKLVLGGSLLTSWMRSPGFGRPFAGTFDHFVAGPGEEALLEIAGTPRPAGSRAPHVSEAGAVPVRADMAMPAPDYRDFADLPYFAPGLILPYAASSGCSWRRCRFCPEAAEGSPYRPLPPSPAAAQAGALAERLRPSLIHFLDSEMSPAFLRALAANPPGVPWYGFARAGRDLEDPDFCRALRASGCVMLKIGLESGDPAVLESLDKGLTVESSSRVLESLKAAGIAAYVYLLFGTPAEGPEEAEKTLEFAVRHADAIAFLNLAVFNLPAGSAMARGLKTSAFSPGDLPLYREFVHPKGWNRRRVREFLEGRFRRHPAVAPILAGMPPYFGSNHAAFFSPGMRRC